MTFGDASLGLVAFRKDVKSSKKILLPLGSNEMSTRDWVGVKNNSGAGHKKQCRPRKPPIPNCMSLRGGILTSPKSATELDLCATLRRELCISSSGESFRLAERGAQVIDSKNQSIDKLPSVLREPAKGQMVKQITHKQSAGFDGMSKPPLILRKQPQKLTPAPLISSTDLDRKLMTCTTPKALRSNKLERGTLRQSRSVPFTFKSQDSKLSPLGSKSLKTVLPKVDVVKLGDEDETQRLFEESTEPLKVVWENRSSPIDKIFQEPDYGLSPQPSPSPAPRVPSILVASPSSPSDLSDRTRAVKAGRQKYNETRSNSNTNITKNVVDPKIQGSASDTDGTQETLGAHFSSQEEGKRSPRKGNCSRKNVEVKKSLRKSKGKRRRRNPAHAMIYRHNTRPRANKPSEVSPMPVEDAYSHQVSIRSPITQSSITDRHRTRPRANKQPEPSPMPVEEIYTQIRMPSPAAAATTQTLNNRQSSPNPNPRSSTPGSTMTFSSVTSMATSPAYNNTQVHEGCSSRTFEETSDPREQEGMVVKGVKHLEGAYELPVPTRNLDMTTQEVTKETIQGQAAVGQQANAQADPVYSYQNSCLSPNTINPVVCVFNPQGGPPTYYDIPPGATMTFSNGPQLPIYPQPVQCPAVQQVYCTSPPGTPQTYYQPVVYSPTQVQFQPPQFYEHPQYQAPQMHPSYALMRNQHPVNVNLPLTTENVNMHNLSNMS